MKNFDGYLDTSSYGIARGWAIDYNDYSKKIKIDIYIDDTFVESIIADKYRDDLKAKKIGDAFHSFEFNIPSDKLDINPNTYSISAIIAETGGHLKNSPKRYTKKSSEHLLKASSVLELFPDIKNSILSDNFCCQIDLVRNHDSEDFDLAPHICFFSDTKNFRTLKLNIASLLSDKVANLDSSSFTSIDFLVVLRNQSLESQEKATLNVKIADEENGTHCIETKDIEITRSWTYFKFSISAKYLQSIDKLILIMVSENHDINIGLLYLNIFLRSEDCVSNKLQNFDDFNVFTIHENDYLRYKNICRDMENKHYEPGITVITPTGDRGISFRLLQRWISKQTLMPSQWLIIDDGINDTIDTISLPKYAEYHKRQRQAGDYRHTLANQLAFALPLVRYDKVVIMEDDDWYHHKYLEIIADKFSNFDLGGFLPIRYYHYFGKKWIKGNPLRHTSLAQTFFSANILNFVLKICLSGDLEIQNHGVVDRFLWHKFSGKKFLINSDKVVNIGFKGLPGREGLAEGHDLNCNSYKVDDSKILKQWIGEDIEYINNINTYASRGVVYTTLFGGIDCLCDPLVIVPGVDYICFTDSPNLKSKIWEIYYLDDHQSDSVRLSRLPKILPHKYLSKYDWSLYIDGNISIVDSIVDFLENNLNQNLMTAFRHPERTCIYQEASVCALTGKDDPSVIYSQIKRYKYDGMPNNFGLTENNVLLRKHNHPDVIKLNEFWHKEYMSGSKRDQLSFSYAVFKTDSSKILSLFDNGIKISQCKLFKKIPHFFSTPCPNATVSYYNYNTILNNHEVLPLSLSCHTTIQQYFPKIEFISGISFKIGTHKSTTCPVLSFKLFGLTANDSQIIKNCLYSTEKEVPLSFNNKFISFDFDKIDTAMYSDFYFEISGKLINHNSMASIFIMHGNKKTVHSDRLMHDKSLATTHALYIDGEPILGQMLFSVRGY